MTHNRETEYFCFEHGLPYPKEEISCPHCIREICEEHDMLMGGDDGIDE